jgi:hypothetical protein
MPKIDYKSSVVIFIIIVFGLHSVKIQDHTLDSIRDLAVNLTFIIGYLFCYLGWKNRILLINYFWTIIYINIEITTNGIIGLSSLSSESDILINKIALILNGIGLLFLLLGISGRKIKYITDYYDYPIKKIVWISVSFTLIFQIVIRLV